MIGTVLGSSGFDLPLMWNDYADFESQPCEWPLQEGQKGEEPGNIEAATIRFQLLALSTQLSTIYRLLLDS